MKLQRHETPQAKPSPLKALPSVPRGGEQPLAELKAQRQARKEAAQRVEELRAKLLHITEQHMDQAVRILRDWLG
jgi:hypothetical protein